MYTLGPESSLQGHSLGVNGLAIDPNPPSPDSLLYDNYDNNHANGNLNNGNDDDNNDGNKNISGIFYSAGRDGNIIAWQLCDMNLESTNYTPTQTQSLPNSHQQPQSQSSLTSPSTSVPGSVTTNNTTTAASSPFSHTKKKSISSLLISDKNESVSRLIGPSLAAFLNATPPQADIPTIPAFPPKGQNGKTVFKVAGPIHTNWVNDILLTNDKSSVISCSSDLTVKLWNPHNNTQTTVGQHQDFVKCLASSSTNSNYIYSAGLDQIINCWNLETSSNSNTNGSSASNHNNNNKNYNNPVFSINVGKDDNNNKSSIYSLAAAGSSDSPGSTILAAGGPDATVRLWDSRTASANAKPIASFLGHTDNIRSLLISENGDWVLSGSADSSIKLWSVKAGRLLHTFDMHADSVWSLHSQCPSLQVFYSSDRTGTIVKTDLRGVGTDIDKEGVCTVIAKEHDGVSTVATAGPYLWAATCNSRIHRWMDFDTTPYAFNKTFYESAEGSEVSLNEKEKEKNDEKEKTDTANANGNKDEKNQEGEKDEDQLKTHFLTIDGNACLRFNKNYVPNSVLPVDDAATLATLETGSVIYSILSNDEEEPILNLEDVIIEPLYQNPVETLQGKIGLIKHQLLPNRRHVLTLDTAGVIRMWDLIQAVELKSFGTGLSMDDIADSFHTYDVVSNWCQVNTRSGELFITLDQNSCFDAEVYADELLPEIGLEMLQKSSTQNPKLGDLPADLRINLGKWVLKNLFSHLVATEVKKDSVVREELIKKKESGTLKPRTILHSASIAPKDSAQSGSANGTQARSANNSNSPNATAKQNPGIAGRFKFSFGKNKKEKKKDDKGDGSNSEAGGNNNSATAPEKDPYADHDYIKTPFIPTWNEPELKKDDEVVLKDISSYIESRYEHRLHALGPRKENVPETEQPVIKIESNNPFLDSTDAPEQEKYGKKLQGDTATTNASSTIPIDTYLPTILSPPSALDAPILHIPDTTKLIISQLLPGSEGLVDLYRGSVGALNSGTDDLEKVESLLPEWVTRAILLNQLPVKDETKTWFVMVSCTLEEQAGPNVEPLPSLKPSNALNTNQNTQQQQQQQPQKGGPGNNQNGNATGNKAQDQSNNNNNSAAAPPPPGPDRFSGYHMLRTHKAMSYLVEKLHNNTTSSIPEFTTTPELCEEAIAHPERWLELTCQGQPVSPKMTLATVRTRMWRSGGDMILKYRRKVPCELKSAQEKSETLG